MNHEEIEDLIDRLKDIHLQLSDEIVHLQSIYRVRQASRYTGTREGRSYTSQQEPEAEHGQGEGEGTDRNQDQNHNRDQDQNHNRSQKKKLKVGDSVRVTRGRNQGTIGTIVKETPSQFEISSPQVIGTFRKWKNNVKKTKN